jgi:acyl-CoA hydrolase
VTRLIDALAPGQRVFVSTLSTESALLERELRADPERAAGVTFAGIQFPSIDRIDYLALHPQARVAAHFMSPAVRLGLAQGRATLSSLDYTGIARELDEGEPFDVAIAQLTPPDADGWCSPGLAGDFMPLVWPRARRRVAHLNPRLPRLPGSFRVHVRELDADVIADEPLLAFTEPRAGDVEARIAAHVAGIVRDGDTLQFGIGAAPLAVAQALSGHRRLRIHAGMVTRAVMQLWHAGALDRDARITTGVVLGDDEVRAFFAALDRVWLTDVRLTHAPRVLADIAQFVAINGAVEVDLFGQVNAERAGGVLQAGAGGMPAFVQGALASRGGRAVTVMPASAKGGSVSRIVPALGDQALCTLPRHASDIVVTEHGVARLRGAPLDARAQALIAIAAPSHRDALARAWDALRGRL